MKKSFKRTAAFVLALTLVAGTLPANVDGGGLFDTAIVARAAKAADITGDCGAQGSNVTYKLEDTDSNGTYDKLTISGTGVMADYNSENDRPWRAHVDADEIQNIYIENGVTSIGKNAFINYTGFSTITLPASITKIGENAFNRCNNLTTVTFTPAVAGSTLEIGEQAFSYSGIATAVIAYGTGDTMLYHEGLKYINAGTEILQLCREQLTWKCKPVTYMDWNGTSLVEKSGNYACKEYTPVTSSTDPVTWGNSTTPTWYVVSGNVTISERITVTGTVNLILTDGATLTASKGINVPEGATLNIYGQSAGTGELNINGVDDRNAGIGGNVGNPGNGENCGTVTINGGTVNATGGKYGAGIGGGAFDGNITSPGGDDGGDGGKVTINGGTVNATGGKCGAGIGGGSGINGGDGGIVIINGGTVTATGGSDGGKAIGKSDVSTVGAEITIADGMTVKAGDSADSTTDVTSTFENNHDYRYVKIGYPEVTADTPIVVKAGDKFIVEGNVKAIEIGDENPNEISGGIASGTVFKASENNGLEITYGNGSPMNLGGWSGDSAKTYNVEFYNTDNIGLLIFTENKVYKSGTVNIDTMHFGDVAAPGVTLKYNNSYIMFQQDNLSTYQIGEDSSESLIKTTGTGKWVTFAVGNNAFYFDHFDDSSWAYFNQTHIDLAGNITILDSDITVTKQGETTPLTGDDLKNVEGEVVFTANKPFVVNNTPATLSGGTYTLTHSMSGDTTAQFVAVEVNNSGTTSYYKTLSEALTNAADGATVKLMDNVEMDGETSGFADVNAQNVTLDLNGFAITGNNPNCMIYVQSTKSLTIKDTSVGKTGTVAVEVRSLGSLTIENGTFTGNVIGYDTNSNIIINDGQFSEIFVNHGTAMINGGTFSGSANLNLAIIVCNGSTTTINGGKFSRSIVKEDGVTSFALTINGGLFKDDPTAVRTSGSNTAVEIQDATYKYAVGNFSLALPTISGNVNKTYDGEAASIEASGLTEELSIYGTEYPLVYTYQWAKKKENTNDYENIQGATNATYTTGADVADSGEYKCVVTSGGFTAEPTANVTINKAASSITNPPTAKTGLTYNGGKQNLVEFTGTVTGGTLKYAWEKEDKYDKTKVKHITKNSLTTDDLASWKEGDIYQIDINSMDFPTIGCSPVKVGENTFTPPFGSEVQIDKSGSNLIFSLNGDSQISYPGNAFIVKKIAKNGNTYSLELEVIDINEKDWKWTTETPKGTAAKDYEVWYKVEGDANHNDVAAAQIENVKIEKGTATATAPTANTNLTYNKNAQDLITAGSATNGTIKYAVTADNVTNAPADNSESWKTGVPQETNVGKYKVWYKAFATDTANYNDSAAASVEVEIKKASALKTAPSSKNPTRYSSAVQLINAGTVEDGCKIEYALGTNATTAPTSDWTENATTLTANKSGTFYVWYKVTGTENYEGVNETCITVKVSQGSTYSNQTWTLTMDSYEYDGTAHTPTINGRAYTYSSTQVQYTYYNADTDEELDSAPSAIGNYKVKVYADGGSNYYSRTQYATYSITDPIDENGMAKVDAFKENDTVPVSDGKIFAGWFTDETCTTAYTEDTGKAYAKFIDEKILTVKAQISSGTTANSASTSIRFITSVDSLKYQNVGFKITCNGKTIDRKMTKVYTAINAGGAKVKPTVFSKDSKYMEAYTLNNITKDDYDKEFTVTPYYTTQDGTIVEGKTNTFTIANMIK